MNHENSIVYINIETFYPRKPRISLWPYLVIWLDKNYHQERHRATKNKHVSPWKRKCLGRRNSLPFILFSHLSSAWGPELWDHRCFLMDQDHLGKDTSWENSALILDCATPPEALNCSSDRQTKTKFGLDVESFCVDVFSIFRAICSPVITEARSCLNWEKLLNCFCCCYC